MREWVGDRLRPFDQQATERRVRDAGGQVRVSVRLLLGLLADGVKLTPGGRLPRVVVRAVPQQRPDWYPLGRPASIEEDLLPLAALHDILHRVGLLRLAKGVLRRPRPPATSWRWSAGSEPDSRLESSPRSSPSARWPSSPGADR